MRLMPVLLLNVVTVVVALLLYDQFRGDAESRTSGRATSGRSAVGETIGLEERLRRIEAQLAAIPEREDRDLDVMRQLREARESAAHSKLPAPSRDTAPAPRDADPSRAPEPQADAPTEEEVERFRKLQEAVRREKSVKANWDRISGQLDKAGVNLTPAQREKIHFAWAEFEPRVGMIWTRIKTEARTTIDAGGAIDGQALREQGLAQIQSEFAASLSEVVNHPADAEAVATALTAPGKK